MRRNRQRYQSPSADSLYKERMKKIRLKLKKISQLLDVHAAHQAREPGHYGYAGDLGYYDEKLDEILRGLIETERKG